MSYKREVMRIKFRFERVRRLPSFRGFTVHHFTFLGSISVLRFPFSSPFTVLQFTILHFSITAPAGPALPLEQFFLNVLKKQTIMKTTLKLWIALSLAGGVTACDPSGHNSNNQYQEGENKSTESDLATKVRTDDGIERSEAATKRKDVHTADANFLAQAANGGITELELGKLAIQKASSPQVKEFAQMMVNDHTKANNELKALADQMKIRIPAGLSDQNRLKIETITKNDGKNFDREYMLAMVKDHKITTEIFQSEVHDGNDSLIKAYASKTLPVLMHHREMAEKLSKAYGTAQRPTEDRAGQRVGTGQNPKQKQ